MGLNLTLHHIIYLTFSLSCENIQLPMKSSDCYLNATIISRDFEFWSPLDYRKIPFSDHCFYASCKYNNCNIKNDFPICKDKK